MFTLRHKLRSSRVPQNLLASLPTFRDASTSQSIQIPPRIERGPTDILRALASTVKRDPTAVPYKYHDDPFLIPASNSMKRTNALAQEAGRKAAIWIRQEHADLFQHREADPVIPAFLPRAVYDENSEVSEEILSDAIKNAQLSDALTIYGLLKSKNGVSIELKQSLLELLCYCNDQEPISEELTEERWFRRSFQNIKPKWKSSHILEELFDSLKNEKNEIAAAAYNALICGTAKYLQVDRAWSLYNEAEDKGFPLFVRTYNSILRLVQFAKENGPERQHLMVDLLKTMSLRNVKPNIGTLNASLQIASLFRCPHPGRDIALSIYKEMTNAGVQPSLGTYFYLLTIFCRSNGPVSEILIDILDKLEGKEMSIQDPQDLYFFVKAMDVARHHLMNVQVAHRIQKLLFNSNNYNLIGENYMESIYYRHYLILVVQMEPLSEFMKLYDSLVPNIYTPESDVVEEILQSIEVEGFQAAADLLPRIWSQIVIFDYSHRESILKHVLQIMHTSCKPPPESPSNKEFAEIAWDIWTRVENKRNDSMRDYFKWTGDVLGQIAALSIRGEEFDRALTIFNYVTQKEGSFTGVVSKDDLIAILDACVENGHTAGALSIVTYAANNGFSEAGQMGFTVAHSLSLSKTEENKLINLVGKDVLQLHLG